MLWTHLWAKHEYLQTTTHTSSPNTVNKNPLCLSGRARAHTISICLFSKSCGHLLFPSLSSRHPPVSRLFPLKSGRFLNYIYFLKMTRSPRAWWLGHTMSSSYQSATDEDEPIITNLFPMMASSCFRCLLVILTVVELSKRAEIKSGSG